MTGIILAITNPLNTIALSLRPIVTNLTERRLPKIIPIIPSEEIIVFFKSASLFVQLNLCYRIAPTVLFPPSTKPACEQIKTKFSV